MYSLKAYNTMHVESRCPEFYLIREEKSLPELLSKVKYPHFILGGGSNVLLPDNLERSVLHNVIKGIDILEETEDEITLEVGAGVVWHEFVLWAVRKDYYGVENLSLIPGTVGAAPIQNIGAYGVEIKDVLLSVRYCELGSGRWVWKKAEDCGFSYRDSIFKRELKGKYFISKIRLKLSKTPQYNLNYGPLSNLSIKGDALTARDVSDAIIAIRQSKLPDPEILGNSGSFFQNPIVEVAFAQAIKERYPEMPSYLIDKKSVKIPAAWLIEQSGLKGKRYGNVGCYEKHALVIVNYGGGTYEEIVKHVERVQKRVFDIFRIALQPEVNIM